MRMSGKKKNYFLDVIGVYRIHLIIGAVDISTGKSLYGY